MDFFEDLQQRGLIQDSTTEIKEALSKGMMSGYIGFDPTADSLHVGSLLPITLLMRLQQASHKPYALVGGATGMIGDPSGKSAERNLLQLEELQKNIVGIKAQLARFLHFDEAKENAAVLVNNYDWFQNTSFLDFIRDIGKHITVSYMLAKDSVQKRLETGLSFTEFSYQLIQGYDFLHLYQQYNVTLQMGGADQWGNIVTGMELIRRKANGQVHALTSPLITKADGSKFGKTESGNIWLDRNRTSPYQFYQFWLRLSDEDAVRLSLAFSFRPLAQLQEEIAAHQQDPGFRALQKALAEELTVLVHGQAELDFAKQASQILFGKSTLSALQELPEDLFLEVMEGVPQVPLAATQRNDTDLISFLCEQQLFPSKGEARKLIQNNGFSINKEKVSDGNLPINQFPLLSGKYLLLQKGKKDYTVLVFQ